MRYALPLGSAYRNLPATAAEIRRFSFTLTTTTTNQNNNFYSRKAAESEENICHFLLRQLVYFKPL